MCVSGGLWDWSWLVVLGVGLNVSRQNVRSADACCYAVLAFEQCHVSPSLNPTPSF